MYIFDDIRKILQLFNVPSRITNFVLAAGLYYYRPQWDKLSLVDRTFLFQIFWKTHQKKRGLRAGKTKGLDRLRNFLVP